MKLWSNSNKYVEIRSMRSFLRGSIVLKLYPNQQSHPRYMSKHYYPGMMPIISFFHIIFSFVCKIADWKQVLLATHICHISRKPYSVKYFLVVDADPHSMTTARGANNINSNKPWIFKLLICNPSWAFKKQYLTSNKLWNYVSAWYERRKKVRRGVQDCSATRQHSDILCIVLW